MSDFTVDLSTVPTDELQESADALNEIPGDELPPLLYSLYEIVRTELENRPTHLFRLIEVLSQCLTSVPTYGDNPEVEALRFEATEAAQQALGALRKAVALPRT